MNGIRLRTIRHTKLVRSLEPHCPVIGSSPITGTVPYTGTEDADVFVDAPGVGPTELRG